MTSDLIGRGWAFPCAVTPVGTVKLSGGAAELDAAITMILQTAPGERVMRPEFGCTIWRHVFDPITARTLGMMEQAVREAILRWEPRVDLDSVSARPAGEGCVQVEIRYLARSTNDYRNLVFPFYVIPQEVGSR